MSEGSGRRFRGGMVLVTLYQGLSEHDPNSFGPPLGGGSGRAPSRKRSPTRTDVLCRVGVEGR